MDLTAQIDLVVKRGDELYKAFLESGGNPEVIDDDALLFATVHGRAYLNGDTDRLTDKDRVLIQALAAYAPKLPQLAKQVQRFAATSPLVLEEFHGLLLRETTSSPGSAAISLIDSFLARAATSETAFSEEIGIGIRLIFDPEETSPNQAEGILHPVARMKIEWPGFLETWQARHVWAMAVRNIAFQFRHRVPHAERENVPFAPQVRYEKEVWDHFLFLMDFQAWMFRSQGKALYDSLTDPDKVPPDVYREKIRPFLIKFLSSFEKFILFHDLYNRMDEEAEDEGMRGRMHDFNNQFGMITSVYQYCESTLIEGKPVDCSFLLPATTLMGMLYQPLWTAMFEDAKFDYKVNSNSEDFDTTVIPDQAQLGLDRILLNVITNAIKYSRPGVSDKKMTVTLSKAEGRIHIVLEDNGRGMSKEELSHWGMGERWRAESAKADIGLFGLGQGSTVIRRLTEELGGEMTITSQEWSSVQDGFTRIALSFPELIFKNRKKILSDALSPDEWSERLDQWASDPANPDWKADDGAAKLHGRLERFEGATTEVRSWIALSIAVAANRLHHEWNLRDIQKRIEAAQNGKFLQEEKSPILPIFLEYSRIFFDGSVGNFLNPDNVTGENDEGVWKANEAYLSGDLPQAREILARLIEKNAIFSPMGITEATLLTRLLRFTTAHSQAAGPARENLGTLLSLEKAHHRKKGMGSMNKTKGASGPARASLEEGEPLLTAAGSIDETLQARVRPAGVHRAWGYPAFHRFRGFAQSGQRFASGI
ncbi:MAG: ATP-binding protein, partial [Deltaproteobacteria bacterium]|nr:ATP-binding protein [Deltaproteobacteria bacterium]